ncbi:MAG: hypothetical protein GF381_03775 [Candidatus Pacebacteria bacterium]|nr:hypothetical protein [Candidatus Paceibacterota bacterium]
MTKKTSQKTQSVRLIPIIVLFVIVALGGFFAYQFLISPQLKDLPEQNQASYKQQQDQEALPQLSQNIQQQATAQLYFDGSSENQVGQLISLNLFVKSPDEFDAVELVVHYPPDKLENVVFDPADNYLTYARQKIDSTAGRVSLMVLRSPDVQLGSEVVKLGTLTARTKEAGQVELVFDKNKTLVAAFKGQNILESAVDFILQIE